MSNGLTTFDNLDTVASHLRKKLEEKKYILLFANNDTGKTRLSMVFKELGKNDETRDTLYFSLHRRPTGTTIWRMAPNVFYG